MFRAVDAWWKTLPMFVQVLLPFVLALVLAEPYKWVSIRVYARLRTFVGRYWTNRSTKRRVKAFRIMRSEYNVYVRWAANPAFRDTVRDRIRLRLIKSAMNFAFSIFVVAYLYATSQMDNSPSPKFLVVCVFVFFWLSVIETTKHARQDNDYLVKANELIRKRGTVVLRKRKPRRTLEQSEATVKKMAENAGVALAILDKVKKQNEGLHNEDI